MGTRSRVAHAASANSLRRKLGRHDWARVGLRVGLASSGLVYLLLGYFVARIALGALAIRSGKPSASGTGVADAIARQPGGRPLLLLLAAGLLLYALFSLVDAVLHHNSETPAAKRWGDRALSAWGFLVYGAFCGYCVATALASPHSQGPAASRRRDTQWSARVLRWPGGSLWLGALGLTLLVIAVFLLTRAARRSFRPRLHREQMTDRAWALTMTLGVLGYIGRAALFGLVGWYVVSAAVTSDPRHGQGVDGSLRLLAGTSGGAPLLWAVALLLVCYGCYLFAEARYRRVG